MPVGRTVPSDARRGLAVGAAQRGRVWPPRRRPASLRPMAMPRDPSPTTPAPGTDTTVPGPATDDAATPASITAEPGGAKRVALLGLGYACLGMAALGAVLPLLPTTVFLIIAAWAFGSASPALRARLLSDPRVGPTLRDWQQHRTVSRRAKRAAAVAMAISWTLATVLVRDLAVAIISGTCLLLVAAWLLTRPSAPPPARCGKGPA